MRTQITRLVIHSLSILFLLSVSPVFAADLNGPWTKATSPDPQNLTLFFQQDREVQAIGFSILQGKKAAWRAAGTLKGDRLRLNYQYSADALPRGWEAKGTMELTLSEDGSRLIGTATSASGGWSDRMEFRRIDTGP